MLDGAHRVEISSSIYLISHTSGFLETTAELSSESDLQRHAGMKTFCTDSAQATTVSLQKKTWKTSLRKLRSA